MPFLEGPPSAHVSFLMKDFQAVLSSFQATHLQSKREGGSLVMGETGLPRHPPQGDLERPVVLWLAGQGRLSWAPHSPLLQPLTSTILHSVSTTLTTLGTTCKWNFKIGRAHV